LYYTGNYNADLAAAWIIENEDKDINASFEVSMKRGEGEHKKVIVIHGNMI